MNKLLIEILDFIIVEYKVRAFQQGIYKALEKGDYKLAIKLRNKRIKLEKTLPTIKNIEKLRNTLTTKDK